MMIPIMISSLFIFTPLVIVSQWEVISILAVDNRFYPSLVLFEIVYDIDAKIMFVIVSELKAFY